MGANVIFTSVPFSKRKDDFPPTTALTQSKKGVLSKSSCDSLPLVSLCCAVVANYILYRYFCVYIYFIYIYISLCVSSRDDLVRGVSARRG